MTIIWLNIVNTFQTWAIITSHFGKNMTNMWLSFLKHFSHEYSEKNMIKCDIYFQPWTFTSHFWKNVIKCDFYWRKFNLISAMNFHFSFLLVILACNVASGCLSGKCGRSAGDRRGSGGGAVCGRSGEESFDGE
jgi:hypothetical protein